MRGLAAAVMLQGHVLEGWVRPEDRRSEWFWLSQFLGGFPAPIFLFLVGVSLALVLDRMRSKGASTAELAIKIFRRGGWILMLAYTFRLEQYLMWYPASKGSDVFRVDTLNCIAMATLVTGFLSIIFTNRRKGIFAMGLMTAVVVFATPWIYPLKLEGFPSFFVSYFNGNGHSWYFSLIPWVSFTLAGITFGYVLLEARERRNEKEFFNRVAVGGIASYAAGTTMSFFPIFQYGFFDYSLTSPHFFLVRLGILLLIAYGAYRWSIRATAGRWSPLIVFGQASLLVYWIHVEIVYGRPFHQFARALNLWDAAQQLLWVIPLMLAVALSREFQIIRGFRRLQSRVQLFLERRRIGYGLFTGEILTYIRSRFTIH